MSKDSGENLPRSADAQSSLRDRIAAAIWEELEAQQLVGFGPYVDRVNGVIDTEGSDGIDMAVVADAVIVALPELQADAGPAQGSYASNFCRGGCDCSCCYGYADEPCHCRDAVCNCGGDRAAHGQKPLEDK